MTFVSKGHSPIKPYFKEYCGKCDTTMIYSYEHIYHTQDGDDAKPVVYIDGLSIHISCNCGFTKCEKEVINWLKWNYLDNLGLT